MKNRTIPYGYVYSGGVIVIDSAEQKVLLSIFDSYLSGMSMLQIAQRLTADAIEFIAGNSVWNKARIKRIIEERRYLGSDEYPRMITPEKFEELQSVKDGRNSLRDVDRASGIYQLDVPVICSLCGEEMKRMSIPRSRQWHKWVCGNDDCQSVICMGDALVLESITALLNTIIENPSLIQIPSCQEIPTTREQIDIESEILRLAQTGSGEEISNAVRQKAALRYSAIGDEAYHSAKLRHIFTTARPLDEFSPELTNETVNEIILSPNGSVTLVLINGQRIGGKDNAAD